MPSDKMLITSFKSSPLILTQTGSIARFTDRSRMKKYAKDREKYISPDIHSIRNITEKNGIVYFIGSIGGSRGAYCVIPRKDRLVVASANIYEFMPRQLNNDSSRTSFQRRLIR